MLAMFCIAGGHWSVLQTVAWAEMLREYSQRTGSLTAAVEQTFDGQHPCALCREIRAAKSRERKGNPASRGAWKEGQVKARLAESILLPVERTAVRVGYPRLTVLRVASRTERPPTPPPRRGVIAA